MKFGLFYELQCPKPLDADQWGPEDEQKVFMEALEQIEFADKLGFDYVFEVEHDFLEEYAHSSAPEVVLAAASQRTKNIRLGHGIIHAPPSFNHPIRVAERISTLDIVSGGRVEFGTGEGGEIENTGYGIDVTQKKGNYIPIYTHHRILGRGDTRQTTQTKPSLMAQYALSGVNRFPHSRQCRGHIVNSNWATWNVTNLYTTNITSKATAIPTPANTTAIITVTICCIGNVSVGYQVDGYRLVDW